ncbi:MAG: DUF4336 domain-containing protein [Bdellovibrionaceae bacterium]|nr:DUF4336 domain-containing protein [Bdellovibrionales bacterium]MCB9085078.1 DUF4336 domain-containing protein [Pseudobdellovibrionaceae bacterium]
MSLEIDWGYIRTYTSDMKLMGANFGARMTIIKMNSGDLFIHSPIPLTAAIRQEIDDFGRVGIVVAPNDFHHLYVKDYMASYLEAEFLGSPGLRTKRPDLKFSRYFSDEFVPAWKSEIDFVVFRGSKTFHEVVFYHPTTKTLILTDLAMNLKGRHGLVDSLVFSLAGVNNKFTSSRILKSVTKNRVLAREAVRKMLQWPFEKVIVAHGELITGDARNQIRQAFAWLA